jgi:RHS repeat-associated protein
MNMTRAHFVVLALVLAFCTGISSAQVPTGTPPLASFGGGPDIVNLANLNSHINIPVLNKNGRGLNFSFYLTYDSYVWTPVVSGGSTSWQPGAGWGWNGSALKIGDASYTVGTNQGKCLDSSGLWEFYPVTTYKNWVYFDGFATPHSFGGNSSTYIGAHCGSPASTTGFTAIASDGSGYTITVTGSTVQQLVGADGNLINPNIGSGTGGSTQDRNGNQITYNRSTGAFTDTLGTTPLTVGGSGTPSSPTTYTYTGPSGASAAYKVNYTQYTVRTYFNISGITDYAATSIALVSSIVLPDNSQYTFTYEATPSAASCTPLSGTTSCVTARVASVTLPTGGQITYSYNGGNNGIFSDGSAATLTRATPDGTWTYAQVKGTGAASTTTVTDPQGNQTVIQFQGIYETQRQVYQGGTLLLTTNTCYNGSASPCNGTAITPPISQRTIITTLPGNLQSKHFDSYSAYGLPTESDDCDYGSGAPGALLRKTTIAYASLGNINAFPHQVTVYNATTQVAQTTYNYDETGVTTSSGTPQHASVSGSRGNLTSINYPVSGLTAHFTYYDTGTVSTATDVNGAVTTNSYPDATSTCGNAFPTSVSEPLSLSRSMTWNCIGGVQLTAKDENGQITSTAYTDPYFWRPSSSTDAANAQTNFTYTGQNSVEAALTFNSGNSATDVLTTLDGLGRVHLKQTRQAPGSSNFDTVETDYDALGRASRVTLPYAGTAGQTNSSAPATVTTYDPLSRPTLVTDAGGGSATYSYPQNDVTVTIGPAPTGENTKRRQLEYDALGRVTSVCEITGATGSGTCGQSSAQTGFWTKYSYTFDSQAHPLLNVTQNAQAPAGSQQARSYAFDAMNRPIFETNPESSTTAYTLDSDSTCGTSTGDRVKRVDAVGNTTCTTYDALHRVTSVTYSGPYASSTPNKYLVYDSATVNGVAMANAKNRLAEAYTATSQTGTKITDEGFSYSRRGELTDLYQLTPHSGSYYHVSQTYWPHGAPSQLSGNIGLPTIQYGGTIGSTVGLDGEGRITQITASSGQNPVTGVSFNTASLPSQVSFGSGDTDIFGYDSNTLRMTQYQFKVNGQSDSGTLTWNANSTLQKLAIADAFNGANNQTCNYGYDDLTRLTSANCGSAAAQTFSFDAFGNINKSGSPYSFQPTYSSSTNRMTSLPGFTPTYDNNGNVTNDSNHTYAWDADGNSVTVDTMGLTFDALDRAVEKNNSGTYTEIVYAPTGAKLALMGGTNLKTGFVSLPGQAQAVYTSSGLTYYRHSDWLGSSRLSSTSAAAPQTSGKGSATLNGSEQSIAGAPATAGTGTVSFSGTLQSKQVQAQGPIAGSGSVTFNGTLQSKQVQTQAATPGKGTVSISGNEQSKTTCPPLRGCTTIYDTGTVTITVNNHGDQASYGQGDTATSVASKLASAINSDSTASVTASASNSVVTLTSKTTGSAANYALSASVTWDSSVFPSNPSFTPNPSGSTLTGGANATYTTVYDSGSSTITVNGHGNTVSWSGSGTTTSSIASALAANINADSSAFVTASASGSTVNLVSKVAGASTNYSLASSWTFDSNDFSSATLTSSNSGATLTGGKDAVYTTVYDSGSSTITVNGHADSVSWSGSGTTMSSIASALASSINADSGASVTASASGSIVSLTAKTIGAHTNYSLASSGTFDSTDFSSSSFTSSTSGSTLTGGHDAGATTYDSGNVWATINGTQYSVSYGQTSTTSSLATALANAINTSSIVTAAVSGSTINLTATTTGASTNYSLSSGSSTSQPSSFSQPSFTVSVSGSTLTGGGGGTSMYADTAYAPFGETYAQAGVSDLSFTGQNQDTVSGDYDFLAREYSMQGRWPSPDPAGLNAVNPTNPQSWNRYAYVLNSPLAAIDPTGLDPLAVLLLGLDQFGGGGGCSLNGFDTLCGTVAGLVGAGAAGICPNNDCSGISMLQGDAFIGSIYRPNVVISMLCQGPQGEDCGVSYPQGWGLGVVGQVDPLTQIDPLSQIGMATVFTPGQRFLQGQPRGLGGRYPGYESPSSPKGPINVNGEPVKFGPTPGNDWLQKSVYWLGELAKDLAPVPDKVEFSPLILFNPCQSGIPGIGINSNGTIGNGCPTMY